MRSRIQTWTLVFIGFLIISGTFGAGFASATVIQRHLNPRGTEPETFDLFWEVWGLVEQDFYGNLPSGTELTYSSIRGSLTALNDPYSIFVEPDTREMERDDFRGSYGGIGAYVTQNEDGEFVLDPINESQPSALAGILSGDILLEIDGQPVTSDMTVEDVVVAIRGPLEEEVKLTVRHADSTDPVVITVKRAVIELPSANWRILEEDNNIGYLQITRFTARTSEEVETAIEELVGEGAEKLIIDLRHNPGGLLTAAVDVASHFLDADVVLYERRAGDEEKSFVATRGGVATEIPLAVLVDGSTASASEILAGALQDHQRATLIGQITFGKGAVQNVYELSDGSSLHITAAQWFTPNYQELDGNGLTPEIEISPENADDDIQLTRAIEYLQTWQ
jgi:carboxyl-terminal processing protease